MQQRRFALDGIQVHPQRTMIERCKRMKKERLNRYKQIEYGALTLCSAYYSGCSKYMIKALMRGLKEVLGDRYIDFVNEAKKER